MNSALIIIDSFIDAQLLNKISTELDTAQLVKLDRGATDDGITFTSERYSHITKLNHVLPAHSIPNDNCPSVFQYLMPYIRKIQETIESSFNCTVFYEKDFMITPFIEGESLDPHFDSNTDEYTILKTPNGNPKRDISSVLYLNGNYSGGEIEFINLGVKIKPRAGMLILFPGDETYTHFVHPVTSGKRFVIPQFWALS